MDHGDADLMSGPDRMTVLFVDLVRFTSLTEVHGNEVAADAALELYEIARDVAVDGVELVKTLGDGVLFVMPRPMAAVAAATQVVERLHELARGLDARAGADHGVVTERGGDVFGTTVNVAARAADLARPGALVVTRPVALSASNADYAVVPIGPKSLKGLMEPVELFEIDPCEHDDEAVTDPVCGMRVNRRSAIVLSDWSGGSLGFCSSRCVGIYEQAPDRFS